MTHLIAVDAMLLAIVGDIGGSFCRDNVNRGQLAVKVGPADEGGVALGVHTHLYGHGRDFPVGDAGVDPVK